MPLKGSLNPLFFSLTSNRKTDTHESAEALTQLAELDAQHEEARRQEQQPCGV